MGGYEELNYNMPKPYSIYLRETIGLQVWGMGSRAFEFGI